MAGSKVPEWVAAIRKMADEIEAAGEIKAADVELLEDVIVVHSQEFTYEDGKSFILTIRGWDELAFQANLERLEREKEADV